MSKTQELRLFPGAGKDRVQSRDWDDRDGPSGFVAAMLVGTEVVVFPLLLLWHTRLLRRLDSGRNS